MTLRLALGVAGAACLATGAAAGCRQALALAIDVSASVDDGEYRLQRDGLVAALSDPDVRYALFQMPEAPVVLSVYEWSGTGSAHLLVPWTEVGSEAGLAAFLEGIRDAPRLPGSPATAIGDALAYGRDLLSAQGGCGRLTLDVAGDGRNNQGPEPYQVPMTVGGRAVTVNGLAVGVEGGHAGTGVASLPLYFAGEVIRGPDAFVEIAQSYRDFSRAMARKLSKEIAVPGFADAVPADGGPAGGKDAG